MFRKLKYKKGDIVELHMNLKNDSLEFSQGEIIQITYVDFIMNSYDIVSINDTKRWMTDVSYKEIEI